MKFFIQLQIFLVTCSLTYGLSLQAQQLPLYYGEDFLKAYQGHSIQGQALRDQLHLILKSGHLKKPNAGDVLTPSCEVNTSGGKCVQHIALGYEGARKKLFGLMYLQSLGNNLYGVKDVYCERIFTDSDVGANSFGPDKIPKSGNIINTEHTWPQSKFTHAFLKEMQKSDLHHLYPTDSEMNNKRGSLRFGNVVNIKEPLRCNQNKLGKQANGELVFEVPDSQKGNTARSIFYFATRYHMRMSPTEEATLREWNKRDPVDAEEFERNNTVEQLQGNRNPFVDFGDLLNNIDRFN